MKKSKKQKCAFDLLPFHVIEAASTGDTEAIQAVLKHYEGYITVLATRKMFDEFGQVHYCVDETLRQRLEAKLITKTLGFDTKSYVRKSNQYFVRSDMPGLKVVLEHIEVFHHFPVHADWYEAFSRLKWEIVVTATVVVVVVVVG